MNTYQQKEIQTRGAIRNAVNGAPTMEHFNYEREWVAVVAARLHAEMVTDSEDIALLMAIGAYHADYWGLAPWLAKD